MLWILCMVLAAVFLVLGFAGVMGLLLAIGLAVACVVLALFLGSGRVGRL
jgi:hypothetical protein